MFATILLGARAAPLLLCSSTFAWVVGLKCIDYSTQMLFMQITTTDWD